MVGALVWLALGQVQAVGAVSRCRRRRLLLPVRLPVRAAGDGVLFRPRVTHAPPPGVLSPSHDFDTD